MHYLITSLISGIGWGLVPLLDRYSSKYVDALTLSSTRGLTLGVSALLLFIILACIGKNSLSKGYKAGGKMLVALLIISPMIGFFLGHIGYYMSLVNARSSIIQVTLISFSFPIIIVALLSPFIYKDKINWQMILGVIITLIGISITIIYNPNHEVTKPITDI